MCVRFIVEMSTEVVDAVTVPQRVTGALVQRALEHTFIAQHCTSGLLSYQYYY